MTFQSNTNGYVAIKAQTGLGTPAAANASGVIKIPLSGGSVKVQKQAFGSNLIRSDKQAVRGRLGPISMSWNIDSELMPEAFNELFPALLRMSSATFNTASTDALTNTLLGAVTAITPDPDKNITSLTFATDPWPAGVLQNVQLLDVVVFGAGFDQVDREQPHVVVGVLPTLRKIIVTGVLATTTLPSTFSIYNQGLKGYCPATPVTTYFTMEEYEGDIDTHTTYQDVRLGKLSLNVQTGIVTANFMFVGTGEVTSVGSGKYFTTVADVEEPPFSSQDIELYVAAVNGVVVELTAATLDIDLGLVGVNVLGQDEAIDVVDGTMQISASITLLRKDNTYLARYLAGSANMFLSMLFAKPGTSMNLIHFGLPQINFGGCDLSSLTKQAGLRTQTINIPQELIGVYERDDGVCERTAVKIQCLKEA